MNQRLAQDGVDPQPGMSGVNYVSGRLSNRHRTLWAQTVRTCRQLLQRREALWSFLEIHGVEPTNNAAERALRQSVIQRKISHGVQSAGAAICRSRLLTVTTSLGNRGEISGSSWSRPGSPITAAA
jgi:hypothetical protein